MIISNPQLPSKSKPNEVAIIKSTIMKLRYQNLTQQKATIPDVDRLDPIRSDQLVFGSGIGKSPPPAAPLGGENPKNFCKLVLILIEHKKYKNAIEQSVISSPCNPRWLIFCTNLIGTNGILATAFPSKSELRKPKTTKRTTATTAPDLNLKRDRSRLDSLRDDSTRSIFLVLDFFKRGFDEEEGVAAEEEELSVFMVSSFLEALSMEDLRDL